MKLVWLCLETQSLSWQLELPQVALILSIIHDLGD